MVNIIPQVMSSRDFRLSEETSPAETQSINNVLQLCIEPLRSLDQENDEHLDLALETLAKPEGLKTVDTHVLRLFTGVLLNRLSGIFDCTLNEQSATKLLSITSKLDRVYDALAIVIQDVHTPTIHIILLTDLKVLEQCYTFFQNSINNVPARFGECSTVIFGNCQKIQKKVIDIILNNIHIFVYKNDINYDDINSLFLGLCSVGKFIALVDVKTTADTWKCISKLGTECCTFVKNNNIPIPWISFAVDFLCDEIYQSILIILENTTDDDLQSYTKIERILKINSFYLKVVTKFASDFTHQFFDGYESFVKLCVLLTSLPENVVNSKVGQNIKQYLTVGVNALLTEIFQSTGFENALCKFEIADSQIFHAFCLLSMEVLEQIIISPESSVAEVYFHSKKVTIVSKLLEEIDVSVILKRNVYEKLVSTIAALIISISSLPHVLSYFENLMLQGILSTDYLRSLVCCDVMCMIFRFANENVRRYYFKFYLDIYFTNPIFAISLKAVFLKFLLRCFYKISSESQKMCLVQELVNENSKSDVLNKLELIFIDSKSREILNLSNRSKDALMILKSSVTDYVNLPSADSYYKLALELQLFYHGDIDDLLCKQLTNLWTESIINQESQRNATLNKSIMKFLQNNITTCKKLVSISSNLTFSLNSYESRLLVLKTLILDYENGLKQENIRLKILDLSPSTSEILFIHARYCTENNILSLVDTYGKTSVNFDLKVEYVRHLSRCTVKHLCKTDATSSNEVSGDNPPKRQRLSKACTLLSEVKKAAEEIKRYYENEECTDDDLDNIMYIVNIFNEVTRSKKAND